MGVSISISFVIIFFDLYGWRAGAFEFFFLRVFFGVTE